MSAHERPSLRSPLGLVALGLGLLIYTFGVLHIGDYVAEWGLIAETLYYALAGVLWVPPAVKLVRWMMAGHSQK